MSFLGSAIITVCMGTSGNYRTACTNALDAGVQQTGAESQFRQVETRYTRMADRFASDNLGDTGKELTGGMVLIMKTAASRTLVIPIPANGFASSIAGEFKPDSAMLLVKWRF